MFGDIVADYVDFPFQAGVIYRSGAGCHTAVGHINGLDVLSFLKRLRYFPIGDLIVIVGLDNTDLFVGKTDFTDTVGKTFQTGTMAVKLQISHGSQNGCIL